MDLTELLAQKRQADAALADAEQAALAQLAANKQAYRDNPSEDTRRDKAEAARRLQSLRAALRRDRAGFGVGGDAFVVPSGDES